ncbi:RNA-directed DNA polymerase [Vibrio cholerae]|uniref:RNA-directed DNA polymerase n=1 Tax=Vibrio cholerae TaxID=666 RepID=UPI0011D718EC|nr:RNA-directed DNA polymerase [Vibrio cholerae]TXY36829.1 RNA-directed DNA polymerase [Vibrio cholerae]GIB78237.1 reverse transcriptase [Vibrio cholerae]
MSKLTEEAVDFARDHIKNYYDSDFYPKAFEYEAIWHNWEDVKKYLTSTNVFKLRTKHPLTMASKKPHGSYRIVHQLEPLDTIVYTALAYLVANSVEEARSDKDIACSYRFEINNGGFFTKDNGFRNFTEVGERLSNEFEFILITDITDFYNQIYLHRLNNAIEMADPQLKNIADDIESFLMAINDKASQGVPVGPAASIIMSEATLIDIDEYISNKGVAHTRYVDDFRIYSNSKGELEKVLEDLTLYLHESHRLTLASDKTKILPTKEYVDSILHNQYEMEKVEIFRTLEVLNPYSGELEFEEVVITEEADLEEQLENITEQLFKRDTLDLGLARALIRKAKKNKIKSVAFTIFEHFEFFIPVINDVVLYFKSLSDGKFELENKDKFISIIESDVLTGNLSRFWIEWYLATNEVLLKDNKVKKFIYNSGFVENQALAAITSRNVAWVRDNKNRVFYVGEKGKRAILYSTQILPSDERNNWLKNIDKNTPEELDHWMIKWLLETC